MSARPNIVVGYDGSEPAADALALAEALGEALGGQLVLACVYPFDPRPLTPEYESARTSALLDAEQTLSDAPLKRADAQAVELVAVAAASPARALHELAVSRSAQLLVVGSCRRGMLGRIVAGSVARRLLHGAPCPVAIAPRGFAVAPSELGTVGVGFDGTEDAAVAVRYAARLALSAGAKLRVIAVVDTFGAMYLGSERHTVLRIVRDELGDRLSDLVGSLPAELQCDTRLLQGPVPRTLLHELDADVDLLVLGSRGYGPVGSVLLGSVSSQMIELSPVPLVVVPRGAAAQEDAESSQHSISASDDDTVRSVLSGRWLEGGTSASSSNT